MTDDQLSRAAESLDILIFRLKRFGITDQDIVSFLYSSAQVQRENLTEHLSISA